MDIQVADTLLGSLIDGRYRIRGRAAHDGMATVYIATDERLGRTVALKIIHPQQVQDAPPDSRGFLARFTQEAKTIARLTHPNVVAVYDQGTHDGRPYLVMEYVRGRTLREVLAERGRLSPDEALAIAEQMLAAIAAAHRAGLVHRDVKPENVVVAEAPSGGMTNLVDSVVKVADFGLARAVAASSDTEGSGQLMATVAYVAPELVTEGHADPRTDVYAAGIVLFEMLTGRVPYEGDRAIDVAWMHVDNDVPRPSTLVPGIPSAVDELVQHATRRDPTARPTDAGAFQAEVQLVRDGLGNANTNTAVLRQLPPQPVQPTMVVPPIQQRDDRPSWARLPESRRSGRRRAAPSGGLLDRLSVLRDQVMATQHGRMAAIAAMVVLGLVAMLGVWWFTLGRYTEAPQLVALPKAEAEARAKQAGFAVAYGDPRYDENAAKDMVLAQDPAPASKIVKGDTITLILSLGPERYRVPDVVGKTFDIAQADLEKVNLVVEQGPERFDDNYPKGVVIEVKPDVGTEVKAGTRITVTVSKGRAPLSVPNLIGMNINEARAQLQTLGLEVVEQYKDSSKPKDQVIGQSPADGTGVEKGAQVKLEVSKGPPEVVVPRVIDLPCPQAQQLLEAQNLTVSVQFNPNGTVRFQNPGENASVPPGTQVVLGCL